MNIADTKRRFFVRVKAEKKEEAAAVFSSIEEVDAGLTEEFAFITAVMTVHINRVEYAFYIK